jgi:hypothetical protein
VKALTKDRLDGVRQCRLRHGSRNKVAWIPERFARVGGRIKLLDEDGWQVVSAGIWLPNISQHHGYFAGGIFHQ